MDTEIDVRHSIYKPFDNYISGEKLSEVDLSKITKPAVAALDRENGYFFETQNEILIFGFLTKWSRKDGASRKGEFFFNIFSMRVESVLGVDLHALKQKLEEIVIKSPDDLSSNTMSVKIKEHKISNTPNVLNIINQWREYGKAQANLSETSSLVAAVPKSIKHIKYISICSDDADHHNICERGDIDGAKTNQSVITRESFLHNINKQSESIEQNRKLLQYIVYATIVNSFILVVLTVMLLSPYIL